MPRARLRRPLAVIAGAAASLVLGAALAACAPEDIAAPSGSPSPSTSSGEDPTGTPSPSASAAAEIPDDCEEMLSDDVLAQLDGVPLNDPAFGPSGPQADGTLVCTWGDPGADTTMVQTTILAMARGTALDFLNDFADNEGYECYTPDGGTRCEKTWQNETHPVIDGRTLFWRDDILIDTQYSNLAPEGYTSSIVEHIWG